MGKLDAVSVGFYESFVKGNSFRRNLPADRLAALERMYMRQLIELSANRFKWEGLPEDIDPRFLEMELTMRGRIIFMRHPKHPEKLVALRGDPLGNWDYQDNATEYSYIGNDILSGTVSADDCVPIWSNYHRIPDLDTIMIYATKIAQADRTVEINAMSARLTKIIAAEENRKLSMANISQQIEQGNPVIYVTKGFDPSAVTVLDLGVHPEGIVSMQTVKTKMWAEAMTYLGINNANQDKKERLVSAEVGANDEQVNTFRNIALNAREHAVEKINEKFNLNISVSFKNEADNEVYETTVERLEAENGGIHNGSENGSGAVER